jgi:hypothetical protein
MADYKTMYEDLFNSVTKAIEILQEAQINAENTYINTTSPSFEPPAVVDDVYIAEYEC